MIKEAGGSCAVSCCRGVYTVNASGQLLLLVVGGRPSRTPSSSASAMEWMGARGIAPAFCTSTPLTSPASTTSCRDGAIAARRCHTSAIAR